MSAIQIKNVPAELHEALRRHAASEQMSVGDYVLQLLRRDLALPSQREWLDELGRSAPTLDVDVVGALAADATGRPACGTQWRERRSRASTSSTPRRSRRCAVSSVGA